ncbi:MAG: lipopolysaccharide biosynthesis protein, partial [Dysgonamonadaceae bacterium]
MAGGMKTLAKETVIYGGTTIVQKSLSWFLALFYTYVLPSQADMGVFNNFYAWIALFQVILTYGMETGFFRFANKENENPDKVFSTTITSLLCTTLLFVALAISFVNPIASGLNVSDKQHLMIMMTLILALDVISTIPFAYLRYKNRPIRFATVKISNIVVTIILNLFFFLACPVLQKQFPDSFA